MCRFCAMAALLLWAAPLCAADPTPADDSASVPWYQRIFGSSQPKPKPAPAPEPAVEKPPTWKDVSRSVQQEKDIYIERMVFCSKLRQIAAATNDSELERKANDLEALAEQVFTKRTSKLPSIVQEVKSAEKSLDDKKDGSTPSAWADTGRSGAASTITGRAPNGRPLQRDPSQ